MGAKQRWVQTDAGDPLRQQASILAGGEAAAFAAAAMEQEIAWTRSGCREVIVNRLASLLSNLEPDRPTSFALPNGGTFDGIAMRCDVLDPEQPLAHVLGHVLERREAEPVRRQHVDDRVDVPVLVVDLRPEHA